MSLELVTIQSPFTGLQYQIRLSEEEITKCNTDAKFFQDICKKYDHLEEEHYVRPVTNDEEFHLNTSEDEPEEYEPPLKGKKKIDVNYEEHLILAVQSRNKLWDHRLPLKEKSKATIKTLWEEVIEELGVEMTVDEVKSKWKSIRDVYIRARNSFRKKIPSGSSVEVKLEAEKNLKKHRNYELLQFLEESLSGRPVSTNLDVTNEITPDTLSRPSTSNSNYSRRSSGLSEADNAFLETIKTISKEDHGITVTLTPTQHFCMRLADSLDRLPRPVQNSLELQMLQLVTKAEEQYADV